MLPRYVSSLLHLLLLVHIKASAYHRNPCSRQAAAQFSFDDCFLPALNPNLALAEASFVFSHDAATGYIKPNTLTPDGLTYSYTKTQKGTFYQQLQDGARALDLRPKLLYNGTVVFHHGKITVQSVSFAEALSHVIQWCQENPTEIVFLLTGHYSFGRAPSSNANDKDDDVFDDDNALYDSSDRNAAMVQALQEIYSESGVLYVSCEDVYGWSIETVLEQASLPSGGVLLALDGQNTYPGRSCAKSNYIESEIVTCWTNGTSCKTSDQQYQRLENYILQSANNPATDDSSQLGPPNNLYRYPLNQIQALWQVSVQSAAIGLAHFSTILADDHDSRLHKKLVSLIHEERMPVSISLFTIDNVALHGNAITSVLRNRCGQSIVTDVPCGPDLPPPRLDYFHLEARTVLPVLLSVYLVALLVNFIRKHPYFVERLLRQGMSRMSKSGSWGTWSSSSSRGKNEALILKHPEKTLA